MNNSATLIKTTLAEVDALPTKSPKVELQYGSVGYDQEQSFVIKGLIPECSFASIYGPSGSFKSFLALDWACHIATGKDWDGHKVKQGAVLYVAGEGGFGVTQRVRAWELQHKVNNLDNLARLPVPIFPSDTFYSQYFQAMLPLLLSLCPSFCLTLLLLMKIAAP